MLLQADKSLLVGILYIILVYMSARQDGIQKRGLPGIIRPANPLLIVCQKCLYDFGISHNLLN